MFEFEFDDPLLPFKYHKPALAVLFQLPPTLSTVSPENTNAAPVGDICPVFCFFTFARGSALPLALPLKEV